jgi:LysM repeat protein
MDLKIYKEHLLKKLYILLFGVTVMATMSQAATKIVKHTIKNGETLYTIAHKNHTTIEEVRKVNGLKKGDNLKIGRVLNVPTNTYFSGKKNVAKTRSTKTVKLAKHSIKNGETLFTIARKHHTTIEEVRKVNGLKKGDTLKIGRVIKVPKNTYKVPKSKLVKAKTIKKKLNKIVKHSIKKGETLFTIAHANHTTIKEVRKANGLKKGDTLKIGQVLTVPTDTYNINKKVAKKLTKKKPVVKIVKHSIKKGETLFAIARKHHTTIDEVRKTNGLKKGDSLKIGRIIQVPLNTYNVPKVKIAKKTISKKKRIKVVKHTKKSNKKLTASLAKLETITLKKGKVVKHKKRSSLSFSDIFFSSNDSGGKKSAKITSLAKKKLGRRYVWGATGTKNTFDCSGFTSYVYKKNGINIPRTSNNQSKFGKFVSRNNLKKGDLIFFDTSKRRKGYVNHVVFILVMESLFMQVLLKRKWLYLI